MRRRNPPTHEATAQVRFSSTGLTERPRGLRKLCPLSVCSSLSRCLRWVDAVEKGVEEPSEQRFLLKRRLCFGVEGTPDKVQWLPSSQGDGDTEVERRVPYDLSRRQNTTHGKRCGAARNGQSGRIASGLRVYRLQGGQ